MIEVIADGSTMSYTSPLTWEHHGETSENLADGVTTVRNIGGRPSWSLKGGPWIWLVTGSARQNGIYHVDMLTFTSLLSVGVIFEDDSKLGSGDEAFFSVQICSRANPYVPWVDILPACWRDTTPLSAESTAKVARLRCTGRDTAW